MQSNKQLKLSNKCGVEVENGNTQVEYNYLNIFS